MSLYLHCHIDLPGVHRIAAPLNVLVAQTCTAVLITSVDEWPNSDTGLYQEFLVRKF